MLRAAQEFRPVPRHDGAELLAWLRQILVNNLAKFVEQHMLAARRDVRREVSIERLGDRAGTIDHAIGRAVAGRSKSPSMAVQQREEAVLLADRLAAAAGTTIAKCSCCGTCKDCRSKKSASGSTARSARRACSGCGRSRSCVPSIGTEEQSEA